MGKPLALLCYRRRTGAVDYKEKGLRDPAESVLTAPVALVDL